MSARVAAEAVAGLPEVRPGDDLAALIAARTGFASGDVLVVAHKVVSKAEGAVVVPIAFSPGEMVEDVVGRLAAGEAVPTPR